MAFEEANRLNNRDVEVWAYLAILCLKHKLPSGAKTCIHFIEMVRNRCERSMLLPFFLL